MPNAVEVHCSDRGVFEIPATVNGHRVFIARAANREQVGLKTVPPGTDPTAAITQLWETLDKDDPIPSRPHLTVIAGGRRSE